MQNQRSQLEPFLPRLTDAIANISNAQEHEEFSIQFVKDFTVTNLPGYVIKIDKIDDPQQDKKESFSSRLDSLCQEISGVIDHCESISKEQIQGLEA